MMTTTPTRSTTNNHPAPVQPPPSDGVVTPPKLRRRPWFAPAFVSGFGLRIKQHLYGLRDTFRRVRDEHE